MTTSWPRMKIRVSAIADAVNQVGVGEYREISLT